MLHLFFILSIFLKKELCYFLENFLLDSLWTAFLKLLQVRLRCCIIIDCDGLVVDQVLQVDSLVEVWQLDVLVAMGALIYRLELCEHRKVQKALGS